MVVVRKGQTSFPMTREEFHARREHMYFDPRFDTERDASARLEEIAWRNYLESRKAPRTTPAGPGFADPEYKCPTNGERHVARSAGDQQHARLRRQRVVGIAAARPMTERNVARSVSRAVTLIREGRAPNPDEGLISPRQK